MTTAARALSTDGIDAALTAAIGRALALAGHEGALRVSGMALADVGEHRRASDDAHLLLMWEDGDLWLAGGDVCAACLRAWRSNRWRDGLYRVDRRVDERPSLPPAATAWLAAMIVQRAGEAPGTAVGARLFRPTLRLVSDHRVLRHADCLNEAAPRGGARDRAAALLDRSRCATGYRARPLSRIGADLAPLMVDERCGLVRWVSRRGGGAILPMTEARLFPFEPSFAEHGYGRGGRDADNGVVALLEALERVAGLRPPGSATPVRGCYADLADHAIDHAAFILPAPAQRDEPGFGLATYAPDVVCDWVWGYSFRRRDAVLVPAQCAFPADVPRGERFVRETSSGCAAGSSIVEAAFHGLLEVIERDAFLVHWYGRRPVGRVDPARCEDAAARAILARLAAADLAVDVYDVAAGPEAAAIAVRVVDLLAGRGPACAFAAGAHVDPAAALRGALVEAATSLRRSWSAEEVARQTARGRVLLDDPSLVRTMADHVAQCWPVDAIERRGFVVADDRPADWSTLGRRAPGGAASPDIGLALDRLVASTLRWCEDVIVVDQSLAPFAARSVHCVKVLAPGLLPMTFGHQERRVDPRRWGRDEVAAVMPHPFP